MVSAPRQSESLGDYLHQHLNLPLDFEGPLTVRHLADVALLATADSAGYMMTQHLVSLMAGVPTPTDEPYEDFWFKFWQASGSAYFMPANMKPSVLAALNGEGDGLANHILSGFAEMSPRQWTATAVVVGTALNERFTAVRQLERNGELWLRDFQLTAWRVLYAAHFPLDRDQREAFREGWKNL